MARKFWHRKLARPVRTTDGAILETLQDGVAYALAVPERKANQPAWQAAAGLLAAAGEAGTAEAIEAATKQLEFALFEGKRLAVEEAIQIATRFLIDVKLK